MMRRLLVLALCIAMLPSCTAPAFSESQYRSKVATTAEDASSAIETVRVAVGAAIRHDLPSNPIDVAVSDQEDILSSVSGTFAAVQPPTADMIELREEIVDLLGDAQGKIEAVRIELRRGNRDAALARAEEAGHIATELEDIAARF